MTLDPLRLATGILHRLLWHVHRLRLATYSLLHKLRLHVISGMWLRRLLEKGSVHLRLALNCPRLAHLNIASA